LVSDNQGNSLNFFYNDYNLGGYLSEEAFKEEVGKAFTASNVLLPVATIDGIRLTSF